VAVEEWQYAAVQQIGRRYRDVQPPNKTYQTAANKLVNSPPTAAIEADGENSSSGLTLFHATAFWAPDIRHHGRPVRGDHFDVGGVARTVRNLLSGSKDWPEKCAGLTEGFRTDPRAVRRCAAEQISDPSGQPTVLQKSGLDQTSRRQSLPSLVSQTGETFNSANPGMAPVTPMGRL
jgi:hypothetical protein